MHLTSKLSAVFILLNSLVLTGCLASTPPASQTAKSNAGTPKPAWVHNPPSQVGYAYGQASAEIYGSEARALETAQELAKADLLANLRVRIESSTNYSKQASLEFGGATKLQENFNQTIRSSTPPVELTGLQITETWVNPNGKEAWALAQLNTNQAINQLLGELNQLEDRVLARGTQPQAAKLERIRYLKPSIEDLVQRQKILEQLAFLGATTLVDANKKQAVEQLELEVAQVLASLGVQVSATSAAQELTAGLSQALTDLGFNLVTHSADLHLQLDAKFSQINRGGLIYIDATANSKISTAAGRVVQAIQASSRGVSSEASAAKAKAQTELTQDLANSLITTLYQNL